MTDSPESMTPLGDRYEVGELLGRGGMADVRRGRDLRLGRPVAIKQLRADLASDETFLERFRREAQSAASLNHPAIVAVYDTGEAADANGTVLPYIVMELVEGRTLRDIMREDRKILPERALSITAEILSALDYSHRAGIIHRDIKPANVMLTPDGKVKVMDFGIARAIADTSSAMTQTAAVIGTAQYLSPEQARGKTVDARSDIYSTGCVLYELLTGRPPFVGESPVSVAYQHVREEALPPSQLNPDVSSAIDAVVAKALTKDVDSRYSSAADMRRDIQRILGGTDFDAPTQAVPVVDAPTAVAKPVVTELAETDEEEGGSGKGWWWLVGLLGVALAAVVGFVIFMNMEDPPPPTTTIPQVAGSDVETATNRLLSKELKVGGTTEEASMEYEKGIVIGTDPEEGSEVEIGSEVTLIVSAGPKMVQVPVVERLSYKEAKKLLESERFQLKVKKRSVPSNEPKDQVLNSNPPAGLEVPMGSEITLIVSEGQVSVPDVRNMKEQEAIDLLEELGFSVRVETIETDEVKEGRVFAQDPQSNVALAPNSTVTIWIAKAPPEPEPDPDPDPDEDED